MNNNIKCDNCGKENVSYYYSSNINGNVTEKHLCSECAAKLGRESDLFDGAESMFEEMFSGFFGTRRRRSLFSPFGGFSLAMPILMPRIELFLDDGSCASSPAKREETEPDEELSLRREINMLRHEMGEAVKNEEFEKAAELRDKIRALENGGQKDENA